MNEFVSEDHQQTFEGWLKYQAIDTSVMTTEELATWRCCFEEVRKQRDASSKVGLMNLKTVPGASRLHQEFLSHGMAVSACVLLSLSVFCYYLSLTGLL